MIKCPHCQNKIVKSEGGSTSYRIKGMLRVDDHGAHAHCYWCGGEVEIPVVNKTQSQPVVRAMVQIKKT